MIRQLKFQQSFVEYVEVPQLQFIDSMVGFPVASRRQGSQCKLCRRRRFARCSSWIGTRPSLCNDRPRWSRQFSLEVPQVQFLPGCGKPGGASDSVHRKSWVCAPCFSSVLRQIGGYSGCATETGTQCKLCRSPLRSHRCSSWIGWDTPVVVQRQLIGFDSAENCGASAVAVGAVLGKLLTCPFVFNDTLVQTVQKTVLVPQVQFIDVGSSRCEHAAKVPASFSAKV